MGKELESGKAFRWSLFLHGGVVVLCFGWMLLSMAFNRPREVPVVMELVGGPPVQNPEPRTAAPAPERGNPLELPSLPKLDQRDIPQLKPEPTPAPQKVSKPKPAEQKKPELIDYKQFSKENKLPPKVQQKAAPKAKPVSAPKLDSSAVLRDLRNNLSREDSDRVSSMSVAQQGELFDYFQWVRSLIDANFRQPSGIVEGTSAWVEFRISAEGVVTNVRITTSSGNASFDAAAQNAVRSLGKLRPPPGKVPYTRKIEFISRQGG